MISRKMMAISVTLIVLMATLGGIIVLNKSGETPETKTFIDQAGSETMYELCLKWVSDYEAKDSLVQINVTRGGAVLA